MTTSALFWFCFHKLINYVKRLALFLGLHPFLDSQGRMKLVGLSGQNGTLEVAKQLSVFFLLPFIFPSWSLNSCIALR